MQKLFIEALLRGSPDPWWDSVLHGGGKSPPAAPDYTGAAQQQGAASQELATQNTFANRPTINTPWGQQTWDTGQTVDPATGQPVTTWTQNLNLTPDQQASLDSQQAIQQGRSGAAQQLLGQATGATANPFDWSSLPGAPTQAAQGGDIKSAQMDAYQQMAGMLQPGRQQQQAALDTKLANMGLPSGSEAANRAGQQLQSQWTTEDKNLIGQAMQQGQSEQAQQYGQSAASINQQQQLRNSAIAEEAQRRGMPLNELNALLTGQQVSMPQMPSFSPAAQGQTPDLLGAAQAQGQYGLGATQLNQNVANQWSQGIQGAAGLGVAAAMF
jgi:hypothetical protein